MLRIDMLVAFVGLGNRQACMLALLCHGLLLLEGLGVRGLRGGPRALVLTRGQAMLASVTSSPSFNLSCIPSRPFGYDQV